MIWPKKKPTPAQRWTAVGKRLSDEEAARQREARDNQPRTKVFQPYWPYGSVGRFYVKKDPAWGDAQGLMAVEQLPVLNVRRIDSGYVLLVGAKGEYLFEVDHIGESAECVPWDDEMQREFELHGEDIPPTYDMPEPVEEPEPDVRPEVPRPMGLVTQTDERLYSTGPLPEQRFKPVAVEELGNEDPTESLHQRAARNADEGHYAEEPENFYRQATDRAREWIRRDAEMTRQREADAAAVEAAAEVHRREAEERARERERQSVSVSASRRPFTEEEGTQPIRVGEPKLSDGEAAEVESFANTENRQEADQ